MTTSKSALKIHILCGNAAFNKGDRGNLDAQIKMLGDRFPGAEISYDSFRPEVDSKWYRGANVIQRGKFLSWAQVRAIWSADVIVWGGGALIADNSCRTLIPFWFTIIFLVKVVLRKPIMAWAQGLVVETKLGALFGRWALNLADVITVRDQNSYETLKRIGATKPPHFLTADPAITVRPDVAQKGEAILKAIGAYEPGRKLIAISPTYWPFYYSTQDWLPFIFTAAGDKLTRNQASINAFNEALTKVCTGLAEKYDARVLLLPRYPGKPWSDLEYLKGVRDASPRRDQITVFENDVYSPEEYLAIYPFFDCLISTALHDAIFATAMDVPCVKLYYEAKGRDFFLALDAADRLDTWEILFQPGGVGRVLELVDYTLKNWDSLLSKTLPHKQKLQKNAVRNADLLAKMIERPTELVAATEC